MITSNQQEKNDDMKLLCTALENTPEAKHWEGHHPRAAEGALVPGRLHGGGALAPGRQPLGRVMEAA